MKKNISIIILGSIIILAGIILLWKNFLLNCNNALITYNSIEDYGKFEEFKGYSNLLIFPSQIPPKASNSSYYFKKNSSNLFDDDYQIYLTCQYDQETYKQEVSRLAAIKQICGEEVQHVWKDEKNFLFPAIVAIYNNNHCYEYALLDDESKKIYYIFLQFIYKDDVIFDKSLLPYHYVNPDVNSEKEGKSIYLFRTPGGDWYRPASNNENISESAANQEYDSIEAFRANDNESILIMDPSKINSSTTLSNTAVFSAIDNNVSVADSYIAVTYECKTDNGTFQLKLATYASNNGEEQLDSVVNSNPGIFTEKEIGDILTYYCPGSQYDWFDCYAMVIDGKMFVVNIEKGYDEYIETVLNNLIFS